MKFACQRDPLLKEIALAIDYTSQRNTLSIESNVLLETMDDTLTIKATDQKMAFITTLPVETIQEGSTTVFCEKFLGILRSLPEEIIILEEIDDKLFVHPKDKSIEFTLHTISYDKFPTVRMQPEHPYFMLPQRDFFDMVNQTIFAVSVDESRYFLNGIFLERGPDSFLTMVATDGKRLSYISRNIASEIPSFEPVIIPAKFLSLLKKAGSGEGDISLCVDKPILYTQLHGRTMYTTLIKGPFPNYHRVIPATQDYCCRMSIADMNEALKRVSLFVENKAKRIYLQLEPGSITITSEESDFGQAKESIACEYEGAPCQIAMNYSFLASPLHIMEGEYFALCFTAPNKAITVRPDPERDYFHIIMPMQID